MLFKIPSTFSWRYHHGSVQRLCRDIWILIIRVPIWVSRSYKVPTHFWQIYKYSKMCCDLFNITNNNVSNWNNLGTLLLRIRIQPITAAQWSKKTILKSKYDRWKALRFFSYIFLSLTLFHLLWLGGRCTPDLQMLRYRLQF